MNMKIFDMNIFVFINWFFLLSFFGYVLECIVFTIEHKQLVMNRGFVHGPFCIIYGFGAVGAYLMLKPVSHNLILLYLCSSALATTMEIVTAKAMIRLFGSFWWDYSKKPFNYKGIICLESSIGWGFLGIVFFYFLDGFMKQQVYRIPFSYGKILAIVLVIGYICDFAFCVYKRLRYPNDDDDETIGRLKVS